MANAAQNFLVDSATIKGGAQLIQGADYSTPQGWLEGGVGAIGIAAATADAGLNFATGGVKGAVRPSTQRVFWTGGKKAMTAAMKYAKNTGRVTLEMTKAGKRLMKSGRAMERRSWIYASKRFAKGAEDIAHVFRKAHVDPESIWKSVEEPILKLSSKISEIIEHIIK